MTYSQEGFITVAFGAGALGTIVGMLFATAVNRAKHRLKRGGQDQPTDLARRFDVLDARVANVERMLEVVAIEIERTGEGQRYLTQLLAKGSLNGPAT